jgi:purine nucleoside permease
MTVDLAALVLPAFDDIDGVPSELAPWKRAGEFDETLRIDGLETPLRYTNSGVGVVPTGIGKAAAATTVTALVTSDEIRVEDTLFLSVGVAGGPPALDIGSVVVADSIVDWDHKCRFDPENDEQIPLVMNPHTGGVAFQLCEERVDRALDIAGNVSLASGDDRRLDPRVVSGTNLCGDELWHGEELARQVEWLLDEHDVGPYHATEMEDAGTAFALDRLGYLDQYLCVRGISNYDRPLDDTAARESLFSPAFEDGFGIGIENAVSVACSLIDARLR